MRSRRGSVTILAAVLMVFMLAMVAFAVDIGHLCDVQSQIQAAADAGALAGAKGLPTGSSTVISNAQSCVAANKANGQALSLASSGVVLGTWNTTARSMTALSGTAANNANAVQVTVSLASAAGNPVSSFFAQVMGVKTENVSASAIAGANRWDVIISQDISESYSDDLSYAIQGHQTLLADFEQYSPSSYLGVVQHTGWGSTWASLQQVGTNNTTLNATMGSMQDCSNNTTSAYNVYGGTTTSIAVTTQTPNCSGSDLATGIQQAINMFDSSAYTASMPAGTSRAIILSSDGQSNASSYGQHASPTWTDTTLNTLAQTTAAAACVPGHFRLRGLLLPRQRRQFRRHALAIASRRQRDL